MHPRPRSLTEHGGLDDVVRSGRKTPEQPVGPLGLFGGAPDDAAHQKELRIVASMPFGVDRFHFNTSRTRSEAELDQHPRGLAIRTSARSGKAAKAVH
jgi:hypothetical protein